MTSDAVDEQDVQISAARGIMESPQPQLGVRLLL